MVFKNNLRIKGVALMMLFIMVMSTMVSCKLYTVVDNSKVNTNNDSHNQDFNVEDYINSIWKDKVSTYFEEGQDINDVAKLLKTNPEDAKNKYGIASSDSSGKFAYVVKGEGIITEVNKESQAGYMYVDINGLDGDKDIYVQIGPVIKGNYLRDSMDFIKFNDFNNQIIFSELATGLNKKTYEKNLSSIDFQSSLGKTVEFSGALYMSDSGVLTFVPAILSIK